MTLLGRLAALALVATAVSFAAAGCGGTELDATKTEELVKEDVEEVRGAKVASVDCPSGIEVAPKTNFTCEVRLSSGKTETAKLQIRDEDANLNFLSLEPAK
jgi:Domain of unknown function (DUF4333)